MSNKILIYLILGIILLFAIIVIFYMQLRKKMMKSDYKRIRELQQGTKSNLHSSEIMYQKLYVKYVKMPFIKRYAAKLRRRLEIIDTDDEYATRRDTAKILTRAILILVPLVLATILITRSNYLIMGILDT